MESQVPEMQIKPATRGSSQRLLALDAAEEEKAATINANSAVAVPRREGRMSTRGKATVPSWQRSDIYELDAPSPTFSDSDTDDVSTSVQDSKLKALFFIKRYVLIPELIYCIK